MGNWVCEKFSLKIPIWVNPRPTHLTPKPNIVQNRWFGAVSPLTPWAKACIEKLCKKRKVCIFWIFSAFVCFQMSNNGGGQYSGIPSRKLNRPPDYGHFAQPLLHFLTLILILHSRSQFAFYEDLRNKSLHPTAFNFFIKSIWQVFCPRLFLFRFWSLWRVIWGQSWQRWPWRKSTCECDWD